MEVRTLGDPLAMTVAMEWGGMMVMGTRKMWEKR